MTTFLEQHPAMEQLYEAVLQAEAAGYRPRSDFCNLNAEDMVQRAERRFNAQTLLEERSYNCHSYAFLFFQQAGVPMPTPYNMSHVSEGSGYMRELARELEIEDQCQHGMTFQELIDCFGIAALKRSSLVPLHDFHSPDSPRKRAAHLVDELNRRQSSRYMHISLGNGFLLHSGIVLGPTIDGTDAWVLHRNGVGGDILIDTLSDIIYSYENNPVFAEKGKRLGVVQAPLEEVLLDLAS